MPSWKGLAGWTCESVTRRGVCRQLLSRCQAKAFLAWLPNSGSLISAKVQTKTRHQPQSPVIARLFQPISFSVLTYHSSSCLQEWVLEKFGRTVTDVTSPYNSLTYRHPTHLRPQHLHNHHHDHHSSNIKPSAIDTARLSSRYPHLYLSRYHSFTLIESQTSRRSQDERNTSCIWSPSDAPWPAW